MNFLIRKKKFWIIIVFLFLALVILNIYRYSELTFFPYPEIDTVFTKKFSWNKFNKVKVGMSKYEVRNILGEPYEIFNFGYECWRYSQDGRVYPYADFSWFSVSICFEGDLVNSKPVNEFGT